MNTSNRVRMEHLEYLDGLRESGQINMFGAAQYLVDEFPSLEIGESSPFLPTRPPAFPPNVPSGITTIFAVE